MPFARVVHLSIALAACAVACSDDKAPPSSGPEIRARRIVIGASATITGELAPRGVMALRTVPLAEAEINSHGGILGAQLRVDVADDGSDAERAAEVVDGFLAGGVSAILGPTTSAQVLRVQDAARSAKILQVTATATSPDLSSVQPARDRFLFRTAPPDDLQGRVVARFMYDGLTRSDGPAGLLGGNCRRAALVHADDRYGTPLNAVIKAGFEARGGQVITEDTIPPVLQSDYQAIVTKIVAARVDCLALVAYSVVAAQVMRDLRAGIQADKSHDWSSFFVVGGDGMYDTAFLQKGQDDPADPKSPNATEGCFGTTPDPAPDTRTYAAFKNIWHARYPGEEPPAYAATTYDAVVTMALAMHKAGTSTDGEKIRDALFEIANPPGKVLGPAQIGEALEAIRNGFDIDYDGASGEVNYDDRGDVRADYALWHVEKQSDGTFRSVIVARLRANDL